MHTVNGFISVDTGETKGVFLSTKCGELRTKKAGGRIEIFNNFSENIFFTIIQNSDIERYELKKGDIKEVTINPDTKELRMTFGLPFEESEYSFTSLWGEPYAGNRNILALFYMVNSTSVKADSLF